MIDIDEIIPELENYINHMNDEVSESVALMISLYRYKAYISEELLTALISDLIEMHSNFTAQYKWVTVEETTTKQSTQLMPR